MRNFTVLEKIGAIHSNRMAINERTNSDKLKFWTETSNLWAKI
jgi:hypothetical protein